MRDIQHKNTGFTLIELLVVISIIGLLSSLILPNLFEARQRAQATTAVQQMRQIHTAVSQYVLDTGTLPPNCNPGCIPANDPLANNPGVAGWNGPYMELAEMTHPWGGSYSIVTDVNVNTSTFGSAPDLIIYLDDDANGTGSSDNSAQVPYEILEIIDKIIDDGVLSTGAFVGHAQETGYKPGSPGTISTQFEGIWIFELDLY